MRTVLQIGESTGITLPAEYLDSNSIERGDKVEVIFSDETAKVRPLSAEKIAEEVEELQNGK